MRLICPNCDAEYDVDDAAIPLAGRDVQCSSCGHAWFQAHPETLSEQEAEDGQDLVPEDLSPEDLAPEEFGPEEFGPEEFGPGEIEVPPEPAQPEPALPEPAPKMPDQPVSAAAAPDRPLAVDLPRRSIDDSILAVLREEAEREAAARRGERPRIETQTEMALAEAPRPAVAAPRAPDPEPAAPVAAPAAPATWPEAASKRSLLPEIEEIKSSLNPNRPAEEDEPLPEQVERRGFRRGFLIVVAVAVVLMALYVLSPVIAAKVPALAGVMELYVRIVNGLRVLVDEQLRNLITWLRGLAAGSAG